MSSFVLYCYLQPFDYSQCYLYVCVCVCDHKLEQKQLPSAYHKEDDPPTTRSYDWPLALLSRVGIRHPSPVHGESMTGLTLCNHSYSGSVSTTAYQVQTRVLHRLLFTPTSDYMLLPSLVKFPGPWMADIDDKDVCVDGPCPAEHSELLIPFTVTSNESLHQPQSPGKKKLLCKMESSPELQAEM